MLRILCIAVYDPHTPLTGTGTRGFQIVSGLAERFTLDLVYIEGSGQPPLPEVSDSYQDRLPGVRSKFHVSFTKPGYFFFDPRVYRICRDLWLKNAYDVVICDYGLSAVYGLLLSRRFDAPFIYFSHNIEYRANIRKARSDWRRIPLIPYVYAIEKLGVRRALMVSAITEIDRAFYTRWVSPERLVVVPQGFDERVYNPFYDPPSNDRTVVLFCGNYAIPFNRDVVRFVVRHVVPAIVASHPLALFKFVGAHPPAGYDHPNVTFTGFIDEYPDVLKAADAVIAPLQDGFGFPTKVIEALACGKHVVATPIGARGIEGKYATLHISSNKNFANTLDRVLSKGETVSQVDFDRLVERYSWSRLVEQLASRMETVVRTEPSGSARAE